MIKYVAAVAAIYAHMISKDRAVARAATDTRRRLVAHLRANRRDLVILDNAVLTSSYITRPLTVLGDGVTVQGNHFVSVKEFE